MRIFAGPVRKKMHIVYIQTCYVVKVFLYAPITFIKRVVFGKDTYWKNYFLNRWGMISRALCDDARARPTLWIDAHSGGEVTQIFSFVKQLRQSFPEHNLVLSTNNHYSYTLAKKIPELDHVFDTPWDIGFVCRRVFSKLRPQALILIESIMHPVLLAEANRCGCPTVLVSAFMSKKFNRHRTLHRSLPFGFQHSLDHIGAKEPEDAEGFKQLGVSPEKIRVTGNMKYDINYLRITEEERRAFCRELGFLPDDPVFVAGSVHGQEITEVMMAFDTLKKTYPSLRLLIAPRYYHADEIETVMNACNWQWRLRTDKNAGISDPDIVVLNTFGELPRIYGIASIIFIGASIIKIESLGYGQNIIEPLVHAKPVLFGPHMYHWREITDELVNMYPALEVRSGEDIACVTDAIFRDNDRRMRLCALADEIVTRNERTITANIDLVVNAVQKTAQRFAEQPDGVLVAT